MSEFRTNADSVKELEKRLLKMQGPLKEEVDALGNLFGDPIKLVSSYIEQNCRFIRSPESANPTSVRNQSPVLEIINEFLTGSVLAERRLFILSEPGVGKSSLLILLKLLSIADLWPFEFGCALVRLGKDSLSDIEAIPNPQNVVLLLDGLDEDLSAREDPRKKATDLLEAAESFARVIITCGNRFFVKNVSSSRSTSDNGRVGDYECSMLFLSDFTDDQVDAYLAQRYPDRIFRTRSNREFRTNAKLLLQEMQNMRYRPMILAHIHDLAKQEAPVWNEFTIYEAIVLQWLLQVDEEHAQSELHGTSIESLYEACKYIAVEMMRNAVDHISEDQVVKWIEAEPDRAQIQSIHFNRNSILRRILSPDTQLAYAFSHASIQEFLVAKHILDTSEPTEIVVPNYASEKTIDFVVKGRSGADEHQNKKLVLRQLKMSQFQFEQADLKSAVIENADLADADIRIEGTDGALSDQLSAGLPYTFDLGDNVPLEMVWIYPGSFAIGEAHSSILLELEQGFWLSKYPITQKQYSAIANINPSCFRNTDDERPVEQVNWHEAEAYCARLTAQFAKNHGDTHQFRLPTEAEWEYACRAGSSTTFAHGDDENQLGEYAWYTQNSDGATHPVGSRKPNEWGLYDMHGNVWEWCGDWCSEFLKGVISDLKDDGNRNHRVIRGGSWSNGAQACRSANRNWHAQGARYNSLGFRVAMVPKPQTENADS